ncbi:MULTISPECIES: Crp/Fnr family transcriptional regulator [Aquimarina]|uniref:Crp/Fnr family transcriptional regulator n=1 Tax=Aquimarina TaxID=290174 RepID=UPI000D68889C|nr:MULTISPECIES: Crp/Fnr family transcriptional regulator [Aquimarina]
MNTRDLLIKFILSIVPIARNEAQEIANTFHPIKLKKGEFLLRENQTNDDYFYLEKGLMRTFLFDLEGNEITTDFFTEDNIVFEVTSFFNRVRSEANIHAITDCYGFSISYEELNTLFHDKPAFRDFGRAILVKEFMASKKRNYGMINRTAEERYQNLLTAKPQILQYSPLKYIASYLGVTDSTLSRLRKKI